MPKPLVAGMPPDCDLPDGYVVRFNALDAATGNQVNGVVVKNVSIFGTGVTADLFAAGLTGPFMLTPGPGSTV
jgi:hypothetical protein